MPIKPAILAALGLLVSAIGIAGAADSHRVVILDIGREANGRAGSNQYQLFVVDIESGKVLAKREIGFNTHPELSPKGDFLATINTYEAAGGFEQRLEFFSTPDLKRLESGGFPPSIRLLGSQMGPLEDTRILADGKEMIVQSMELSQGGSADLATTLLTTVKRELDGDGIFRRTSKAVPIRRSHGVQILRVAEWPRVVILNHTLDLLEVVDFSSGKVMSRMLLATDPTLKGVDPLELENPKYKVWRMRGRSGVYPGNGQYGYLVSRPPTDDLPQPNQSRGKAYLMKIDLKANPPKILSEKAEIDSDLPLGLVAESGDRLFIVQNKRRDKSSQEPSRRLKIFNTQDLKLQKEIDLSINDCQALAASRDGKFLYVVYSETSKMAVVDTATGKEVKVLDNLGTYPLIILPLPEEKP